MCRRDHRQGWHDGRQHAAYQWLDNVQGTGVRGGIMAQHHIYDRLPDETGKAYNAFVAYRNQGVNRTQEKTLEILGKSAGYVRVLQEWSSAYRWVQRAAAWDDHVEAAARKGVEGEAIERKARMIRRHADQGKALQHKGLEHLLNRGIKNSSDAITAIRIGIAIEQRAEGIPDHLLQLAQADDASLLQQYADLIASLAGDDSADEVLDLDADTDDENAVGRIIKIG
jgi:hypothetical protein